MSKLLIIIIIILCFQVDSAIGVAFKILLFQILLLSEVYVNGEYLYGN